MKRVLLALKGLLNERDPKLYTTTTFGLVIARALIKMVFISFCHGARPPPPLSFSLCGFNNLIYRIYVHKESRRKPKCLIVTTLPLPFLPFPSFPPRAILLRLPTFINLIYHQRSTEFQLKEAERGSRDDVYQGATKPSGRRSFETGRKQWKRNSPDSSFFFSLSLSPLPSGASVSLPTSSTHSLPDLLSSFPHKILISYGPVNAAPKS